MRRKRQKRKKTGSRFASFGKEGKLSPPRRWLQQQQSAFFDFKAAVAAGMCALTHVCVCERESVCVFESECACECVCVQKNSERDGYREKEIND